jgi:hypothetical protein
MLCQCFSCNISTYSWWCENSISVIFKMWAKTNFLFLVHFQGLLLSRWGLPCYNGAHWWRAIKKKKIKTKKIQFLFLSHNLTLFFRNYFSNQLLQNPQNEVKQQKSLVSCCNIYFVVFYMLLCVCSKLYAPQIPQKT